MPIVRLKGEPAIEQLRQQPDISCSSTTAQALASAAAGPDQLAGCVPGQS
jgi:hypothetical protein